MDLLKKEEIRAWDQYTISKKKIDSIILMERAAKAFVKWFTSLYFDKTRPISVIAGPGNNGGDGLAVARLLLEQGYHVHVHYMQFSERRTKDNLLNLSQLQQVCLYTSFVPIFFESNEIIIDALLGTGINGGARGEYLKLIDYLNGLINEMVSIDVPSGMDPDGHQEGNYLQADRIFSFEIPKIAFFTEHQNWSCGPIGLDHGFHRGVASKYKLITRSTIVEQIIKRKKYQSKYDFGFGQFCGGSPGMLGSVILASRASMRCGLGRLSVTIPNQYHGAFLTNCPEIMVQSGIEQNKEQLHHFQKVNDQVNAIAIGPGLSTSEDSIHFLDGFLENYQGPSILDADALNIISRESWHDRLTKGCIITPHEKEFQRLFGQCGSRMEMVELQIDKSKELGIFIILKGQHTSISTPDGICYFNNTGNVGLATAGSGDVLTGMVLGFLGQGHGALASCLLGVYLHGLAGDHAQLKYGVISLMASDIIEHLPEVIKNIYEG